MYLTLRKIPIAYFLIKNKKHEIFLSERGLLKAGQSPKFNISPYSSLMKSQKKKKKRRRKILSCNVKTHIYTHTTTTTKYAFIIMHIIMLPKQNCSNGGVFLRLDAL